MNRRIARKMSKEWTAYDLDERKRRPRYTRDQLGRALFRLGSRVGGIAVEVRAALQRETQEEEGPQCLTPSPAIA